MDLEILQGRRGRKVVQVEIHNNWTVQRAQQKMMNALQVFLLMTG